MSKQYRFFGYWNKETQTFEWDRPEDPETPKSASIRTDEIEPTEYMGNANREMFTSLSKLKRRCKEDGYEITGGDHLGKTPPEPKRSTPRELRDMAEKAFMDIKYDRVPISEKERETCRREERTYQEYCRRQQGR